jgi:hypothetical protein
MFFELGGDRQLPIKCSAPLTAPVKATASRRPSADLDRRGRHAFPILVGSEENVAFRLTKENTQV